VRAWEEAVRRILLLSFSFVDEVCVCVKYDSMNGGDGGDGGQIAAD